MCGSRYKFTDSTINNTLIFRTPAIPTLDKKWQEFKWMFIVDPFR